MAVYPGMKPMLEFTCEPSRCGRKPALRRRRRAVKTPDNPRVKSIPLNQQGLGLNLKWISPQFNGCSLRKTKEPLVTKMAPPRRKRKGVSQTQTKPGALSKVPSKGRKPLQELDQNSFHDDCVTGEPNNDSSSPTMSHSRVPVPFCDRVKSQKWQQEAKIATTVVEQDYQILSHSPLCSTQDVASTPHISQTLVTQGHLSQSSPTPEEYCPDVNPQLRPDYPTLSYSPLCSTQDVDSPPHVSQTLAIPDHISPASIEQCPNAHPQPTSPSTIKQLGDKLEIPIPHPVVAQKPSDQQSEFVPSSSRHKRIHHLSETTKTSTNIPEQPESVALHKSHSAEELSQMFLNMSVSPNVYPQKSTTNQSVLLDVTSFKPFSASTPYMENRPGRKSLRSGIGQRGEKDCTVPKPPMPGIELFQPLAPLPCHKQKEMEACNPSAKSSIKHNTEFPSSGNMVSYSCRGIAQLVEPPMAEINKTEVLAPETPYHLRDLPLHKHRRYHMEYSARVSSITSHGTCVVEETFRLNRSDVLAPDSPPSTSDDQREESVQVVNSITILAPVTPPSTSDDQREESVQVVNSTTILAPDTPPSTSDIQREETSTSMKVVDETVLEILNTPT